MSREGFGNGLQERKPAAYGLGDGHHKRPLASSPVGSANASVNNGHKAASPFAAADTAAKVPPQAPTPVTTMRPRIGKSSEQEAYDQYHEEVSKQKEEHHRGDHKKYMAVRTDP